MTWIKGAHTIKLGSDYRTQQLNQFQSNFFGGQFSFNNQMTAINPQRLDANSGIGMASFLLGYPAGGTVAKSEHLGNQRSYLSSFLQDDWKVSRKLTLNVGIEYGLEFPITERYNRKMWFDPTAELPIGKQVGLPLRGGYRFADADTRSPYDLFKRQISPRLGFAYQMMPRTVVRGGYGMFWLPAAITEVTGDVRAPAWAVSTSMLGSIDGGLTPYHTLDNPFPNGILTPPGAAQGLNTLVGLGGAANLRDFHTGYMQQWNIDIQRELGRSMIVEVAYAGSKGTGLPAQYGSQLNQIPDALLAMGTRLQELVPNPFFGYVSTGTLAQPTVQFGQLLRPYPQFTSLTLEGYPIGHSVYHSFQFQFNRRFSTSLIGVAYTLSKGIGNTESRSDWLEGSAQVASMRFLDNNNRALDRSLNLFDSPQRLVVSYSIDLPFGPKQRLLKNLGRLGRAVSGWQLSGIYRPRAARLSAWMPLRISPGHSAEDRARTTVARARSSLDLQRIESIAGSIPPFSASRRLLPTGTPGGPCLIPGTMGSTTLTWECSRITNSGPTAGTICNFVASCSTSRIMFASVMRACLSAARSSESSVARATRPGKFS